MTNKSTGLPDILFSCNFVALFVRSSQYLSLLAILKNIMDTILQLLTISSLMMLNFIPSGQAVIRINHQVVTIGNRDPCAAELGVDSPSDNLYCPVRALRSNNYCYNRSELCNGNQFCFGKFDEGNPFFDFILPNRLDCKL